MYRINELRKLGLDFQYERQDKQYIFKVYSDKRLVDFGYATVDEGNKALQSVVGGLIEISDFLKNREPLEEPE